MDGSKERRTFPWLWALLDVFRRVPAVANMEVSRPVDENQNQQHPSGWGMWGIPNGMRASHGTGMLTEYFGLGLA
jgi:hypothetical protein